MKTHILIIFFSFFFLTTAFGQCDGIITLITQAEVDAFAENYNCTEINGDLTIKGGSAYSDINNLLGLAGITSISGDLQVLDIVTKLENFEGLNNLSSIGGSFIISNNPTDYYSNSSLINFIGLESLTEINGDFKIWTQDVLTNFEGLNNLNTIGGTFDFFDNSAPTSFEGLDNLSTIGGNLFFSANTAILSFEGFDNLSSVGGSFEVYGNNSLMSFEGLGNLSSIERDFGVSNNPNITNFEGLENLTEINGDSFSVSDNESFVNFSGLENLLSTGHILGISDNLNLVSLGGLGNSNILQVNFAEITNNPKLSLCCPLLNFEILDTFIVDNNAPTCNTFDAIIAYCIDIDTKIQAQAFHDENENGFYDISEQYLVQNIALEPNMIYNYIDQLGVNSFYLPDYGNYTLSYDGSNPLWTIDPAYNNVLIEIQDSTFQDTLVYFPLTSVADIARQRVDLSSSITRCNRETNYWLTYSNKGTVTTSGIIELIPDDLPEFISSDPPADSTSNDGKFYWFYNDLYPTHIEKIHLIYEMPGVDDLGEIINFEANIKTNEGYAGHRALLSSELICAYDPNDKLHTPSGYGKENYTLFNDTLEYTIRFQNTGNDTAFNVEIRDELSDFLNLSTFETISSSHNVETQIDIESRVATFKFNDIYLPDSFVNEPASHGFIKYQILGNAGLNENSDVKNTASIYFDENPAIVTNTVNNRMVSELPSMPVASANPSVLDFGEISLNNPIVEPQILTVSNLGDLPLEINAFDFKNPAFNVGELQNLTIEGLSSQEIPIYFKPTTVGDYLSELVLKSNVGDLTINLSGKATMATGLTTFNQTKVQIYPNPSEGLFTLKSDGEIIRNLSVQNSLGEVVLSQEVDNELFEVDLTPKSKGLYFITLETDGGIVVDKVVVY